MRSSFLLWAAIAAPSVLLASCSSVLGYEASYEIGTGGAAGSGTAGQAGAGGVIAGQSGAAGTSAGGSAGARAGGAAGTQANGGAAQGGSASLGGSAGLGGAGGSGGASNGGGAGQAGSAAGMAGSANGGGSSGVAGSSIGGAAGSAIGGAAGSTTGGAAGSSAGGGGGTSNPTDCSVIYVSPTGKDENDGCSPAKPKKRPVDALAAAATKTKELRFCAGSYASEGFELTKAISLRGSYDCTSWTRAAFASSTVRSTITAAAGAKAALVASGIVVSRSVEIEGLAFTGGSGSGASRGAWITKGAAPTIRDCALVGGKANGAAQGSLGALVDQGGAARFERDLITGGEGDTTGDSVASAGLYLASDAGLVDVVGNRIVGGRGIVHGKGVPTAAFYAEPLLFPLVGDHAMVGNVFVGGEGSDASEARMMLSAGLFFEPSGGALGTSVTVRGGQIIGGLGTVGTGAGKDRQVAAAAVYSQRHAVLRFDGVRIYGGDAPSSAGFAAAFVLTGGTTQLIGSLVHAGGAKSNMVLTRVFNLNGQANPLSVEVLGSTLLTGQQSSGAAGIYTYGSSKIVMRSNFFVQQSAYAPAVQLDADCGLSAGSTFEANAFAYTRFGDPIYQQNPSSCAKALVSAAELQTNFAGSTKNIRLTPTNGLSPDYTLGCSGGAACLEKIFVSFDTASAGLTQVLTDTDNELSPRLPALCAVALGGKLLPESPNDLLGKKRPATRTSMGAFQVGEALCP